MTIDDLSDAWAVNNKLNLELLAVCGAADFDLKPGKGKTIRSNFTHLVSVRRMWLVEGLSKEAQGLSKLDWKTATPSEIREGLEATNSLMLVLFRKKHESTPSGRWSLMTFFAYCIAHEAHHRSQIEIALRINGRDPGDTFLYGLWDWSKK